MSPVVNLNAGLTTSMIHVPGTCVLAPRWYGGSGGNGTTTLVTGADDGPLPSVTSYVRKTWTTVGGIQDIGSTLASALPVAPSTIYAFSLYWRTNSTLTLSPYNCIGFIESDAAGNNTGSNSYPTSPLVAAPPPNTWQRISRTFTIPDDAAWINVWHALWCTAGISVGTTIDAAASIVTAGPTIWPYADGDTPGWHWLGTPNASQSVGPGLHP